MAKKFNNSDSSVYQKIMKEWRSLEKNLPESIYVQVYETRIDLLRAVIIGAEGTPYHNGLFFFDIILPSDYPIKPPKVYYHAHGLRLNPNLYAGGKVCLSLINTWSGGKMEKWTQNSTILQLLVSIQGLVLNERPFFNEPGFEGLKNSKSAEWINKSVSYNVEVFILSCKTMVYIMRNPPKNFEIFVSQHFRKRADSILAAIQDYRVLVISSTSSKASCLFKYKLKHIHSELARAFGKVSELNSETDNGSQLSNRERKEKGHNVKKPKKGLMKKLISIAKWIWK
ncbi:putative ubiquitin-conjugating enzyme E2 38 [Forsythia ovata]|uniref:Ubiquitin-conjugating enzyme E2 38 n=2 Tax=Forsythia ovata TaxID=205694 RepID=A0ABD1P7M7_9LAMI